MASLSTSHEYLSYIDKPISSSEHEAAASLLEREFSKNVPTSLHPSIPQTYAPKYTDLMTDSFEKIEQTGSAKPLPGQGVDLSRYEQPSAPEDKLDRSRWQHTIRQASTSHHYLVNRNTNLGLLERFGKNAWLISNSQLEDELKSLEAELAGTQSQLQQMEQARSVRQSGAQGEFEGLDDAWRSALGRAIEAEVAIEQLKNEILEARKNAVKAPP